MGGGRAGGRDRLLLFLELVDLHHQLFFDFKSFLVVHLETHDVLI